MVRTFGRRVKARVKLWFKKKSYNAFDVFSLRVIDLGNWLIDCANGWRRRRNMPVNRLLPVLEDRYYRPLEPRR